ncbi:secreted aspartyl protease [Phycomyces blakesleeanus NRRL 1555(-)]|uniref:Secreted aspartyl protease n=1 Tax=Phycomyces blakesleeanus (strain ATCC 8743b / DSM 1359 / FGSC 10004 / NBRC 33097 / NRRL 1555) TaxID=763407 RepID=A0A167KIE7_PHYB8|nr:secreted aspartyl protease [Phycomyces blakesleeanus NRRL 1555(-)]OAD68177.1 secreted aspartyl protease [Phycomyces blakesleeanus NRRL 1555(-)]|eukprot:XP_018286217.1 secreted aspartyl protease [Phycomyces blakesleeanus NRRL 1555(-)]
MHLKALIISAAIASVACADSISFSVKRKWNKRGDSIHTQSLLSDNGLFAGTLEIGTPPKEFTVLFDYSSPLTWVPSSKCHSTECTSYDRPVYDPSSSSSSLDLHQKHSVKYNDGKCVDIELYQDTLAIAGVPFKDFDIGSAYSVSNIGTDIYSGYIGLGGYNDDGGIDWNTFGKPQSDAPSAYNQTQSSLKKRLNGFASNIPNGRVVKRSSGSKKRWNDDYALFIFGGIKQNLYTGKMVFLDLPTCDFGDSRYWKLEVSCLKIGNTFDLKFKPKTLAKIDSSSLFISGPSSDVAALHAALGAEYQESSGAYTIDCATVSSLSGLTFSFDGADITVPLDSWTHKSQDGVCSTLIRSNQGGADWGLGEAFLSNFYANFDYQKRQVGLAIPDISPNSATIVETKKSS